jgi:two-component system sensor histidine kinase ChiS
MIGGAVGKLTKLQSYNLRMVGLSTQRLINLVNDILDFAKLKHGDIQLKVRPTNLYAVVESVVEVSKTFLGKKDLKVLNRVPEDIDPIRADHNRLQQILYHMLSNAIEYTNSGTVEVYAEKEGVNLRISVSDTGVGIAEEKLGTLFNYFEQIDGDVDREHRGAGLGLAITQRLVALHGGEIDVKSKLEIGTTFSFTIPISSLAPRQEEIENVVAYRRKEGEYTDDLVKDKKRIEREKIVYDGVEIDNVTPDSAKLLIVDDEEMNLWTLRNILSFDSYEIVEATNGFEALDILSRDSSFDLVILDLMMPKMSGFDVCYKIRETFTENQLPVLVLTAKTQISDLVEGFSSGANDYLSKPFSREELLARVKSLVKVKRLTSKLVTKLLVETRREIDLDAARAVQRTLLPETFDIPNIEVSTAYYPAELAGGDLFGAHFDKQGNRAFFFIGDVTGHGVSSALVTGISSGAVYSYLNNLDASQYQDSETVLKYIANTVNGILYDSASKSGHNMSMAFVALEYDTQKIIHLSASHKPVYIANVDECKACIAKGSLLGQRNNPRFEVKEMDIAPGDVLLLYTDGLSDNQGPEGEKIKSRKVMDLMIATPRSSMKVKKRILDYMQETWKGIPQEDDCSIMVIKWNGPEKNSF